MSTLHVYSQLGHVAMVTRQSKAAEEYRAEEPWLRRIVARDHDASFVPGLADYRRAPDLWREVGLMNSRGKLVCFDGTPDQWRELSDSQPLMAGTVFNYPRVTA